MSRSDEPAAMSNELQAFRADLKAAIVKSAEDRITAAVDDEDITQDEADQLTAEVDDNLNVAYQVSQTRTVAANLNITTKALNAGFRAARKALASAAIDKALANGDITSDQATAAKTALDSKTFSGYKAGGVASLGAFADAGSGGPGGGGCGGGPGGSGSSSGSDSGSSSSSSDTTTTTTAAFRTGRR